MSIIFKKVFSFEPVFSSGIAKIPFILPTISFAFNGTSRPLFPVVVLKQGTSPRDRDFLRLLSTYFLNFLSQIFRPHLDFLEKGYPFRFLSQEVIRNIEGR